MGILGVVELGMRISMKVEMTSVVDKMREGRLRWFGYVKRRCVDAPISRCGRLDIVGARRDRCRPMKY